jgi:steroid delta-isomerase-like uncharacterized protein
MQYDSEAETLGRRWFEEVWNQRSDSAIDELLSADSQGHVEGGEYRGPDGFRKMRDMFLSALPDVRIDVEDVLAQDDRAAVRWHAHGTHAGDGVGFAATKLPVSVRGTTWLRIAGGKIVEGHDTWNLGGMLASLRAE